MKLGAIVVAAGLTFGLASGSLALAHPRVFPPALAQFEGRFAGPGGISSFIAIEHGGEGWIRGLDGILPGTCVKNGQTFTAIRSDGIHFSLSNRRTLYGENRATPDGRFAFGFRHRAGDRFDFAYTVWIKARFDGPVVRGRVYGTGVGPFEGMCRGDRMFVARRTG
jgi:hypothetical protein